MAFPLQYIYICNAITTNNVSEYNILISNGTKRIGEFCPPTPADMQELMKLAPGINTLDIKNETLVKEIVSNVIPMSKLVIDTICSNIANELLMISNNSTIAKNGLIKVLCWLRKTIVENNVKLTDHIKNEPIIYQGKLGVYEVYTLYVLSKLGIEVHAVSDDATRLNLSSYNNIILQIDKGGNPVTLSSNKVNTDKTVADFEIAVNNLLANKSNYKNIVSYGCNGEIGTKELNPILLNLDKLYGNPDKTPGYMILHSGFTTPTYEGMKEIKRGIGENTKRVVNTCLVNNLADLLGMHICSELTTLYEKLYSNIESAGQVNNKLMIQCKYLKVFAKNHVNVVIFYGLISEEVINLILASNKLGIKFIIASTEKHNNAKLENLEDSDIYEFEGSVNIYPYPRPTNTVDTIAYKAYQELGETLFNGQTPGLYRDYQFKGCDNVPMRIIYEDIVSMWKVDSQYRPGFSSQNNRVMIPNIFAVINGVKDNRATYIRTIGSFVTDHTIIYRSPGMVDLSNIDKTGMKFNHGASVNGVLFKDQKVVVKNGKLDIPALMRYPNYTYSYLRHDAQMNMLSKIQDILDKKHIKTNIDFGKYTDMVLDVCMNLPQTITQLIQWFDFSKEIPKIIVVNDSTNQIGLTDSIFIDFLYLLGFDIMIFVPTGYQVVNDFISPDEDGNGTARIEDLGNRVIEQKSMCPYQSIILGRPEFDIQICYNEIINNKGSAVEDNNKKGFFSRLFS